MSLAEQVRDHYRHCVPHLLRLRMLARDQAGAPLPAGAAGEVAQVTGAVLAEASAAQLAVVAPVIDSRLPGNPSFLAVRLRRLAMAAENAVSAARDGNATALRQHLRRFDELTSAMWTVHLSVCPPAEPRTRAHARLGSRSR